MIINRNYYGKNRKKAIEFLAEREGWSRDFVLLTENTPTTKRLLTEVVGLLLLAAMAMATFFIGKTFFKNLWEKVEFIPPGQRKEIQEIVTKVTKDNPENEEKKEDALKKALEEYGLEEDKISKFMEAWKKNTEEAKEENADDISEIQKAYKTLKDEKASDEDKKKAKELLEKYAGDVTAPQTDYFQKKEDMEKYFKELQEKLAKAGMDSKNDKTKKWGEAIKNLNKALEGNSDSGQTTTESLLFKRWMKLLREDTSINNSSEEENSNPEEGNSESEKEKTEHPIFAAVKAYNDAFNKLEDAEKALAKDAGADEIGIGLQWAKELRGESDSDAKDIPQEAQESVEAIADDFDDIIDALPETPIDAEETIKDLLDQLADAKIIEQTLVDQATEALDKAAASENKEKELEKTIENLKVEVQEKLELYISTNEEKDNFEKSLKELEIIKKGLDDDIKRLQDESNSNKLSTQQRGEINNLYNFLKAIRKAMKGKGIDSKKFFSGDKKYPATWDETKKGLKKNFEKMIPDANADEKITGFLGTKIKASNEKDVKEENFSFQASSDQIIFERWGRLAGIIK